MNTYDRALFWQNKYLAMEKEVKKAQKGIVRLKRREKYLLQCIDSNESILEKAYQEIKIAEAHDEITEETVRRRI